jgi:hypothetical protein
MLLKQSYILLTTLPHYFPSPQYTHSRLREALKEKRIQKFTNSWARKGDRSTSSALETEEKEGTLGDVFMILFFPFFFDF